MLKKGTILNRLYENLQSIAKNQRITDLRIGLSYVGVRLENNYTGLAALLSNGHPPGCTVLQKAGTYAGSLAAGALKYLVEGKNPLEMAIGVATANALINPPTDNDEDREATTYLDLHAGEIVAMVGLFSPLVERIRSTGAMLNIIEIDPQRMQVSAKKEKQQILKSCDVAIITATTLLNNTFEEIIKCLGESRHVAVIGPSTPLIAEIFKDTKVNHLGGAVGNNPDRIMQIISEGGGTPALRPYLRLVNLIRKQGNINGVNGDAPVF